jgi:hypothetical protein
MKNEIRTYRVKVVKVEKGNGQGIFPTGTVFFKYSTGEEECIAMRASLSGVKAGDMIEMDIDTVLDTVEGARIAR